MTEKEVKKWWEENAKYFQEKINIGAGAEYGPGAPNEKHLKLLGNLKGKEILEIGCGGAQCSVFFAKQGAKVTGIDISKEQLKFARKLIEKNKVKVDLIQGSFQDLRKIKSSSKDIVFSAYALQYSPDLLSVFRQVMKILRKGGLFVFSFNHPIWDLLDYKNLKIRNSYFDTGKHSNKGSSGKFVIYTRTLSEIYNNLLKTGFFVEQIIEPDSRKRYPDDACYGVWDYKPKIMKMVPPTIIFKCRKK